MNLISVDYKEVVSEFSVVKDWIDTIQKNILKKELEEDKIFIFYNYGYFLPKIKNKEEYYSDQFERYSQMHFEERLAEEFSKVRVNVTVKIGNFMMTNRLEKGDIPVVIKDIVKEVTKYKMIIEGNVHNNQSVIDTIPDFDTSIVSFDLVKEHIKSENKNYDIDDILDKISESGMNSLTDEEKEFLKNQSKNI
jgi:hypothetical protein